MQSQFADTPSQQDLLNRLPFARSIARVLVEGRPEHNESLVFGLNGRWGSGKSTLLKFVVGEIRVRHEHKKDEKFEIFEFNPWIFSGQEQLLWSFYRALLKRVARPDSALKKHAKKLTDWLEQSKASQLLDFVPVLGDYSEKLKKGVQHLIGEGALEDIKQKLDDTLISENIRLYVIMDDLDRLTPDEITQVFQLVKLNANFKNTVFLLAYDKDIVVNAVAQKFKDNGERYLAKIVQADYTLPEVLQEDVEAIFFEQVKVFFEKWEIAQIWRIDLNKLWSQYGLKNYFTTLRDVYRYFNGLALRLPDVWKDVNVAHFMVVEAFRIFDYSAYQNLYFESLDNYRRQGTFPPFNDTWASERFTNYTTRELLLVLRGGIMPSITWFVENTSSNLFNPDAFERYFSLRISKIDLSEKDFTDFLSNLSQIQARLRQIYQNGRLENLLRRLNSKGWEFVHLYNIPLIFNSLIQFFDSLNKSERKKYWEVFEQSVHTLFEFGKINQDVSQQLWEKTLILPTGFPQITGFKLLFSFWDFERYTDGNTTDKQQRKIISALRQFSRSWVDTGFGSSEVNKLPMCEDDQYIGEMLFTLSVLDPKVYHEFITKSFKNLKNMAWLLGLIVNDNDGRPIWLGGNSPLLTPKIGSFMQNLLQESNEEEIEELDPTDRRVIECFQNNFILTT